jgi:hypothetical protein
LTRLQRALEKKEQLKKNAGKVDAIPAVLFVLAPRLKRSQRRPAENLGDRKSF